MLGGNLGSFLYGDVSVMFVSHLRNKSLDVVKIMKSFYYAPSILSDTN